MNQSMENIEVQELASGLQYYRREDGIFVFIYDQVTRKTVDAAFVQAVANDRLAYDAGKHIRSIYNFQGNQFISPYLIRRSVAVTDETPKDLVESIAIVGDQWTSRVLGSVARRLTSKVRTSLQIFNNEADAVQWIYERDSYVDVSPYIGNVESSE